jgi:hypothetical protein
MANKDAITISRKNIQKGIVILPLREYQKLCERAVPTYYLRGEEAEELDELVKEGLKEYREGKTIKASSLKEALKIYGKKKNKKH